MSLTDLTLGTGLMKSLINIELFGGKFVLWLIFTVLITLLITRDIEAWKQLMFPIGACLYIIGLGRSLFTFAILVILGVVMAIDSISLKMIGEVLTSERWDILGTKIPYVDKYSLKKRDIERKTKKFEIMDKIGREKIKEIKARKSYLDVLRMGKEDRGPK